MRKRTKARELVLQALYQADISQIDPKEFLKDFFEDRLTPDDDPTVKEFATDLVVHVWKHRSEIDETIKACATNWQLERMAAVDRNILRLAGYELLFRDDIPPKVAINEAVDLAKKFGDLESGKFVNGILDKLHKTKSATGSR
jgi:transcription antitermination factor NusB